MKPVVAPWVVVMKGKRREIKETKSFSLFPSLHKSVEAVADKMGISTSVLVGLALEEWLCRRQTKTQER